jgi:hypothetical protein
MNNRPIPARNINVSNVSFVVGQSKAGRNPSINFKYEGNNLQILVPRMGFPGGVLVRDGETGTTTYTLIGSMKGCDPYGKDHAPESAGEMGSFYNLLLDLEENIIHAAVENSVKWFGKKRSEEAIRDSFKRIISTSTDRVDGEYVPNGKYPPSFRAKVPVYDNRVSMSGGIVDNMKNPVYATPESLVSVFPKGVEANMVVTASIYVIAGGGFGVTWRLQSAQVFPRTRLSASDVFDAVPDEDAPAQSQPVTELDETQHQAVVESNDETAYPPTPDRAPSQQAPNAPGRKRRVAAST